MTYRIMATAGGRFYIQKKILRKWFDVKTRQDHWACMEDGSNRYRDTVYFKTAHEAEDFIKNRHKNKKAQKALSLLLNKSNVVKTFSA
jgi:hypothetical protein